MGFLFGAASAPGLHAICTAANSAWMVGAFSQKVSSWHDLGKYFKNKKMTPLLYPFGLFPWIAVPPPFSLSYYLSSSFLHPPLPAIFPSLSRLVGWKTPLPCFPSVRLIASFIIHSCLVNLIPLWYLKPFIFFIFISFIQSIQYPSLIAPLKSCFSGWCPSG